jgi:hypothetical protein
MGSMETPDGSDQFGSLPTFCLGGRGSGPSNWAASRTISPAVT